MRAVLARIPGSQSDAPARDGGDAEDAEAGTEGAGLDVEWDEIFCWSYRPRVRNVGCG